MGPGPLGAPGPRCRIRVVHATTYCQASYLLSGRLPTIRHAPKRSRRLCTQQPHTCTQQPHTCTQPIHRHAPKRHRHAPKRSRRLCTQQPHTFVSSSFFGKNMKNLHVHKKSYIACFEKNKKLTPTLLRCASISKKTTFSTFSTFLNIQAIHDVDIYSLRNI